MDRMRVCRSHDRRDCLHGFLANTMSGSGAAARNNGFSRNDIVRVAKVSTCEIKRNAEGMLFLGYRTLIVLKSGKRPERWVGAALNEGKERKP